MTLKCISGDVVTVNLSPRNVFSVSGLGITPVGVAIIKKTGINTQDVDYAVVIPPLERAEKLSSSVSSTITSYSFFDGGFSISLSSEWGWPQAVHTYYAYYLE